MRSGCIIRRFREERGYLFSERNIVIYYSDTVSTSPFYILGTLAFIGSQSHISEKKWIKKLNKVIVPRHWYYAVWVNYNNELGYSYKEFT